MDTIQFESVKAGLRQSKEGYMLTLSVHPDDLPDDLMRDFVGSRYMVVMVRVGQVVGVYAECQHIPLL